MLKQVDVLVMYRNWMVGKEWVGTALQVELTVGAKALGQEPGPQCQ